MSQELDNLRTAFMSYLNTLSNDESLNHCSLKESEREQKLQDFIAGKSTVSLHESAMGSPISDIRALKLKSNLISIFGENSPFNKNMAVPLAIVKEITDYFKSNPPNENGSKPNISIELVFELVSFSTNNLDFVMSFPNGKIFLFQNFSTVIEINTHDYNIGKTNFENGLGLEYDQTFRGNIFSNVQKNTRKVFIEYSGNFKKYCEYNLKNPKKSQLYLCTGIVSFDLEDLFREESLKNIYNMNQLTLFAQLNSTTILGAEYDDVSPTSPPR